MNAIIYRGIGVIMVGVVWMGYTVTHVPVLLVSAVSDVKMVSFFQPSSYDEMTMKDR